MTLKIVDLIKLVLTDRRQFPGDKTNVWLGGRVVRMPDLRSTGRGFESGPPSFQVQAG